jgi:peptidoglycan/xylan/chitin deacetylase (PgdA/CDA1 family)
MNRTIVLTFDNLGEANELEGGTWDASVPLGHHPSVTRALPRLLDELDMQDLRATFFVEAINCELNPEAVLSIVGRGHELGIHGWRHESWGGLDPDRERQLLTRSRNAFTALGVAPAAFRPPGGEINRDTPALLREIGCHWISPCGGTPHVDADGFGWVPFEWELVDAYYRMDSFGELRASRGDAAEPLPSAVAAKRLRAALEGPQPIHTLTLHAFLMLDDEWWRQVRHLLGLLRAERDAGSVSVMAGGALSERLARRASFRPARE